MVMRVQTGKQAFLSVLAHFGIQMQLGVGTSRITSKKLLERPQTHLNLVAAGLPPWLWVKTLTVRQWMLLVQIVRVLCFQSSWYLGISFQLLVWWQDMTGVMTSLGRAHFNARSAPKPCRLGRFDTAGSQTCEMLQGKLSNSICEGPPISSPSLRCSSMFLLFASLSVRVHPQAGKHVYNFTYIYISIYIQRYIDT